MWAYIFFYGQTRSCTQECDEIKADHEEQLPERFIILWNSPSRSDGCLMTEITRNYAGQKRNHENRPKVAWRLLRYPTLFAFLTCITDSLNFMVVFHVLATLNKQTASVLLLESIPLLIQPICCFTFFYWSCTPNWWFQLFVYNDPRILFLISLLDDCSI